jgi:glucose-1-phosphate thymidylyltransferase
MKAVVLAAGEGSRMRPLSYTRPKALIPVAGEPMLNHVIRALQAAGATEVLLVVQYLENQLREWVRTAQFEGLRIETVRQPEEPYGTGAAALPAEEWVGGEPFYLYFGDILCDPPNFPQFRALAESHPDETILTVFRTDCAGGGAVFWEDGRMTRLVEKPKPEEAEGAGNNAGIYLLQPDAFRVLRESPLSSRGELELTEVFLAGLAAGRPPLVHELTGYWSNVSDAAEILRLNDLMGAADEHGVTYGRECAVGEDAYIREAMLLDRASVGESTFIRHAVLGEGATVGPWCHVGGTPSQPAILADGVTVREWCYVGAARLGPETLIEDTCHIGNGAVLRGCTIESGTHIGKDAVVEWARVGSGAHIGEGAIVEWAEVPAGSHIGAGYRLRGKPGAPLKVPEGSHWE